MATRQPDASRWAVLAGLVVVVVICCAPLFIRLGGLEQRNDEAIYSYSVDRILETGDWLTPRSIPDDQAFLEKPPLKFWMVAGLMKLGVIPHDDWGMRFPDAVLYACALIYVYFFGVRLTSPLAGVFAAFCLLTFQPILFEHGVRGNNMEGTLLLAYCGGVYHAGRWALDRTASRRHLWAFGAFFFLAFMTKFVAAFFLPIVALSAMAVTADGRERLRSSWRRAIAPALVTVAAIAPWFIYQTIRDGRWFWHVLLMQHVVTRFTSSLALSHLHPWHYYFTALWQQTGTNDDRWLFVIGVVALGVLATRSADRDRRSLARLALIWWIVPECLISIGTSKLFYYSYPFLPPLAIGAGVAGAAVSMTITRTLGEALGKTPLAGFRDGRVAAWQTSRLGEALTFVGALALVLALSTALLGSVSWQIDGVRFFKNSSVIRPALVGIGAWYFAGLAADVIRISALTLVSLCLPLGGYAIMLDRLDEVDQPLRVARDCALSVQAAKELGPRGVYKMSGDTDHPYFYYLSKLGPYRWPDKVGPAELAKRVDTEPSLVVMSVEDYAYLGGLMPVPPPVANVDSGVMPEVSSAARSAVLPHGLPPAVSMSDNVVVLFPADYATCARHVAHAGPRTKRYYAVQPK